MIVSFLAFNELPSLLKNKISDHDDFWINEALEVMNPIAFSYQFHVKDEAFDI